ncbi:DUF2185 domain-containing protein [Psychromicrobium xiongbiense]|uniref:DUF2185 domain-containing protein n=1 Tax=Psychromicrobium xiongbiense TaxID=3051184 RepID=UPI0025559AF0|nr:DUF2185 domain-containing protein [Psychromicrobium sp. YIM S02556]
MSSTTPEFIRDSGACVVSLNIMKGVAPLRWLVREPSINPSDNGWRFFSAIDDEAYLDDPRNLSVVSFNEVAAIEPAIIGVYLHPVGSDYELVRTPEGGMFFRDNLTGEPLTPAPGR